MNTKVRPGSRKTLLSHVANFLKRKPGDRAVATIVDRLVTDGVVTESAKMLAYTFAKPKDDPEPK